MYDDGFSRQYSGITAGVINTLRNIKFNFNRIAPFHISHIDTLSIPAEQVKALIFCRHNASILEVKREIILLVMGVDDIQVLNGGFKRLTGAKFKCNGSQAVIVQGNFVGETNYLLNLVLVLTV